MQKVEVVVPDLIKNNCRQLKGYYVPYVIYEDDFKINDSRKRYDCIVNNKCAICGTDLVDDKWLIAGPGSLFHPQGAVIDSANHYDCSKYALEVCPYLAYNIYNKKLDVSKLQAKHSDIILVDPTVELDRVPLFGLVKIESYKLTSSGNIIPKRPYLEVEFWVTGEKMSKEAGESVVEYYLKNKYNVLPQY